MATGDTNDDNNNNNNNGGFTFGSEPFAWALIPLFVILVLGLAATVIQVRRRRRRRGNQWPGSGPQAPASRGLRGGRTSNRRTPWHGTRSEEGLNELGQAPPPYDGKKETQDPLELRDLEAGNSPPGYPDEPPPAVVSDGRRS